MSAFSLAREKCEEILNYDVLITRYENQSEQRRLVQDTKVIGFKIESPWRTKTQMQAYRNHLIGVYGALDTFTFVSPFDDVNYNVRYEPETFTTTFVKGLYRCKFNFKVISEV